jgi:hypothetical protein
MNHPNVSGRGSIEWAQACKSVAAWYAETCKELMSDGVKAYHIDDGWYLPYEGKLTLQYPHFRFERISVGDVVAVGSYLNKPTKHTVTKVNAQDKNVVYFEPVPRPINSKELFDQCLLFFGLLFIVILILSKLPIYPYSK